MSDYKLEIKQIVDYPRCRIHREFIQSLISDRSIRTNNGCSGLFYYAVLCSYANFRTSYRRIDGITYTVYPGEWVCTLKELAEWLRIRTKRHVLDILEDLQYDHLIEYKLLGRDKLVRYRIKRWKQHTVIRDGQEQTIASADLVPGDLMMIWEGVKIPVDGAVVKCADLCVDESSLTGEAEGIWKQPESSAEQTGDYWRRDYCYAGIRSSRMSLPTYAPRCWRACLRSS